MKKLSRWFRSGRSPIRPSRSCWISTKALPCHAAGRGQRRRRGGFAGAVALARSGHVPHHRAGQSRGATGLRRPSRRGPYVKVTFPPATKERPASSIAGKSPRFIRSSRRRKRPAFRRFPPQLAEHPPAQPPAAACWPIIRPATPARCAIYEYADIARHTPPLADGSAPWTWSARAGPHSLGGKTGYGMPGYTSFDRRSGPTAIPCLAGHLSVAVDRGRRVRRRKRRQRLAESELRRPRQWAEKLLATDRDGNGLFEYHMSGNSGSWRPRLDRRSEQLVGHDRLRPRGRLRQRPGLPRPARHGGVGRASWARPTDAARFRAAADKLRGAYFKTFYNPATGVLAGWRSADGQFHDYYFLFVNGIAIHYGLVPRRTGPTRSWTGCWPR